MHVAGTKHDLAHCPGEEILKMVSGKWKPQIIRISAMGSVRFSQLLKLLPEANKQSISVALRELEAENLITKTVIAEKPLHIEYTITEKGRSMTSLFVLAAELSRGA